MSGLDRIPGSLNVAGDGQTANMKRSLANVESLLREVQTEWKQTIHEKSNPLDIALPLMDNTSVGLAHRHEEFLELKNRISNGLKSAVNEHFQSFSESIGSYRAVVHDVSASQELVTKIKKNFENTSEFLRNEDRHSISTLNENMKNYNNMIRILNAIDELKKISNEVETEINLKNYAKAQSLLQKVNKDAQELQLWELPALNNMKEFYQTQEEQLFEILVEEMHNIMYSKKLFESFNTGSNSIIEASNQYSEIEKYLINSIDIDIAESALSSHAKVEEFIAYLMKSTSDDDDDDVLSDLSVLDESNPFNRLLNIMTIIHKQGRLQLALKIIVQRMSTEVNQMVNRVVEDTKSKHSKTVKSLNSAASSAKSVLHHLLYKVSSDKYSSEIIQDLFWNFFKKLLFFKQSVKVIVSVNQRFEANNPDVSHFLLQSDDPNSQKLQSGPKYEDFIDLMKLWDLTQIEIKNLILTYISVGETASVSNLKTTSKSNALFHFYHVDYKRDATDVKSTLQDLFPGFIDSNEMSQIDSPYIEDDRFLKQSKIIPSSILHMRFILEPFLLFVHGLSLLVPDFEDAPFKFFTEFMTNEFLPLLEEAFIFLYVEEVEELNSLELFDYTNLDIAHYENSILENSLSSEAMKTDKIFRFFTEFKIFLDKVCFILNTSLQFRKEFSSIIFKLLNKFSDKIDELYHDLYNEVLNHLESDREIKSVIQTPGRKVSLVAIQKTSINKNELKNSKVYYNFIVLQNSMKFILEFLEVNLIKTIDLNKTDLNLTKIEKLRKNWSFFEIVDLKNDLFTADESAALSFDNINKVILDDELKARYNEFVKGFRKIDSSVQHVMDTLSQVVDIV